MNSEIEVVTISVPMFRAIIREEVAAALHHAPGGGSTTRGDLAPRLLPLSKLARVVGLGVTQCRAYVHAACMAGKLHPVRPRNALGSAGNPLYPVDEFLAWLKNTNN